MRVRYRQVAMAGVCCALWILPRAASPGQTNAPSLQLTISTGQPLVGEPESARIALHIHNPTSQTLWLYRRARGKHPPKEQIPEENKPAATTGGSTVEVRLQPVDAQ